IMTQVEKFFWDKHLLTNSEWRDFKEKINGVKGKIADDYEFGAILFWYGKKLPLNPFDVRKVGPKENPPKTRNTSTIRPLKEAWALLDLDNLPETKQEMSQLFQEVDDKKIRVLVLDGRGRKNCTIPAMLLLTSHLLSRNPEPSFLLTRKGDEMLNNQNRSDLSQLPAYDVAQSSASRELLQQKGWSLCPKATSPLFKGKIYFLMDNRTSRVAEILALLLKQEKCVTLVGQKSAGLALLTQTFQLEESFKLTFPVARFYDAIGKGWSGSSIEPDTSCEGDPLNFLMK
ncbi:MAG: S41 family peptidase, partial [Marinilabiliales bacterium]|nr:S41 family peptidase [Marinilabiliales bacterium]